MVSKIWQFVTTDVRELNWKRATEVTKTGADAGKAVLDLAKAVQEKKGDLVKMKESIAPYVGEISSLLDVLNSPIAAVVKDAIPFAPIAVTMMQLICEGAKREPTLEECVALMSQAAYLESFRELVREDAALVARMDEQSVSEEVKAKIKRVGDLSLDRREANRVITEFAQTELAKGFGVALVARLVDGGIAQAEAETWALRVAWNTPRFFNDAIAEAKDKVKTLVDIFFSIGGRETLERYESIDRYLCEKIATLPGEQVFDETDLSYAEIYVPLQAQLLRQDGQKDEAQAIVQLEAKILKLLAIEQKDPQIVFLQGDAGQGKSVFCRMFADRVRRELFPSFTPILIRLRDLRTLAVNLTETLEAYLQHSEFVTDDSGWLSDRNQRFLFLLDGFDELLLQGGVKSGETGGLKEFLDQVVQFQKDSHHRFVITGRPLSLQGIDRVISQSKNLVRLALYPMQDEDLVRWSEKWAAKFGEDECDAFGVFLEACPKDVSKKLAREPLLRYVLGRMHRDRTISATDLQGTSGMRSKVRIYDKAIKWVLEKQRNDENSRLTGLNCDQLRQLLTEAALCVVQSGNETAQVNMVEMRLAKDSNNPIAELIAQSRKASDVSEQKALNNLLTTFYIKPAADDQEGSIEFAHKSFGEFLFAERLKEAIEDWSKPGERRRGQYLVPDEELHWEIYDFLGYGGLTPEVMDYLMVMLEDSQEWNPVTLFERLNDFWERWCDGEFIDAAPENLPQKKMRLLREQMPDRSPSLGLRQVDIFTGLNVLILLLSLHRYAQEKVELKDNIYFYPSGQAVEGEYIDRLVKVIYYSNCLAINKFMLLMSNFLSYSDLSNADLEGIDLREINLTGATLAGASLKGSMLFQAKLSNTDFRNTSLSRADLSFSNLSHAKLHASNLNQANLFQANLSFANLSRANLNGANLRCAKIVKSKLFGADLNNVNLVSADLSGSYLSNARIFNADLTNANLSHVNFNGASLCYSDFNRTNLEAIRWDEFTNWTNVNGLETAINIPEALKKQLGL